MAQSLDANALRFVHVQGKYLGLEQGKQATRKFTEETEHWIQLSSRKTA